MNILTKNTIENLKLIEKDKYILKDNGFIRFLYNSLPIHIKKTKNKIEYNQVLDVKNSYIPLDIKNDIHNKKYILYDFTYIFNNYNCSIKIYSEKKININKYKKYIYSVLFFFIKNKKQDSEKVLQFTFYLTGHKKFIKKGECIHEININSGYTSHYIEEVVIYRKDEWLKVFIHECMHYFNCDFHRENINKDINKFFNIETDILLFEGYTEFFARIINIAVIIFNEYIKLNKTLKNKTNLKNYKKFETKFKEFINNERIYSMIQMNNVMKLIDIDYKDIPNHLIYNKINEKTNAFCYYYITCIYLYNYNYIISFCKNNNNNYIDFDNKNTELFIKFTIYLIKKNISLNIIKTPNNFNMALYELSI